MGNGGGGAAGEGDGAVEFSEELYAFGRVVGTLSGELRLLERPLMEQLGHGTLTESGVVYTGPVVIGDEAGATHSRTGSGIA